MRRQREKKFIDSITAKDEFHVEEETLCNEMEAEAYFSRIKKGQERLRKNL